LKKSVFRGSPEAGSPVRTKVRTGYLVFSFAGKGFFSIFCLEFKGQIAQLVEQRTENPCVVGSIPSLSTKVNGNFLDVTSDKKCMSILFFLHSTLSGYYMSCKASPNASVFEYHQVPA
jgi:hypothetical protein